MAELLELIFVKNAIDIVLDKPPHPQGGDHMSEPDIKPAVPELNVSATPSFECDLVMKGGVTSGIIYPAAVAAIAAHYRLRSLAEPRPALSARPQRRLWNLVAAQDAHQMRAKRFTRRILAPPRPSADSLLSEWGAK
ncbi:hypothetical protein [Sphingobium subterraneum]|uniref:Uncharacterized protein n=1 Tax=Sphingobium subterraneum TaxID=627688 RepID=A0A841J2U0_9SPHN|nr:hypothetical protein [Sphingobium subterraneum]MBB6122935.1 hypothetical protein [Sphingobium subterraneum]